MVNQIYENLFLGDIDDALEIIQKDSTDGFTHILSVIDSPERCFENRNGLPMPTKEISEVYVGSSSGSEYGLADMSKSGLLHGKLLYYLEYVGRDLKLVRMAIPLLDKSSENLLDILDICLDFIDKNRKKGKVLVHCFAGKSRSASVITAYRMRTEQLSLEAALESSKNLDISPNDGFLEQLKLFEKMDCKVDRNSLIYKQFRLNKLAAALYNDGKRIDTLYFVDMPREDEISSEIVSTLYYRCKNCKRRIASEDNVIKHVPRQVETSLNMEKKRNGKSFNKSEEVAGCNSIFVEPLSWMKSVEEGEKEGKLLCPCCKARLGRFSWKGISCNCGMNITPAFQLQKSKLI